MSIYVYHRSLTLLHTHTKYLQHNDWAHFVKSNYQIRASSMTVVFHSCCVYVCVYSSSWMFLCRNDFSFPLKVVHFRFIAVQNCYLRNEKWLTACTLHMPYAFVSFFCRKWQAIQFKADSLLRILMVKFRFLKRETITKIKEILQLKKNWTKLLNVCVRIEEGQSVINMYVFIVTHGTKCTSTNKCSKNAKKGQHRDTFDFLWFYCCVNLVLTHMTAHSNNFFENIRNGPNDATVCSKCFYLFTLLSNDSFFLKMRKKRTKEASTVWNTVIQNSLMVPLNGTQKKLFIQLTQFIDFLSRVILRAQIYVLVDKSMLKRDSNFGKISIAPFQTVL